MLTRVPKETPMFDDGDRLTRTWYLFFEAIADGLSPVPAGRDKDKGVIFVLNKATAANDVTNQVQKPTGGTLYNARIIPKTGGFDPVNPLSVSIYHSKNDGASWVNIFSTTYARTANSDATATTSTFAPGSTVIEPFERWKIDIVGGGALWNGATVEVWWE